MQCTGAKKKYIGDGKQKLALREASNEWNYKKCGIPSEATKTNGKYRDSDGWKLATAIKMHATETAT